MRIKNICSISFRITFLLSLVLFTSASIQAQLSPLPVVTAGEPHQTVRHTADGRALDRVAAAWTIRELQAEWRADAPASTASVRGVEWISQDRGAIYNQPGELIRVRIKWSSSTPVTAMTGEEGPHNPVPMLR